MENDVTGRKQAALTARRAAALTARFERKSAYVAAQLARYRVEQADRDAAEMALGLSPGIRFVEAQS
jgi:hypothetical protein